MVITSSPTDDELTEKELKQVEADDQAIQTILLGLPEDIYAAVDSFQNPGVQNVGYQNWLIVVLGIANQNPNGNGNVVVARAEVGPRRRGCCFIFRNQLLIAQKKEAGIQLQAEEFDLMAAAADLDEIEEVNANCILMANLQQASTLGTQTDKAPVYDSDGSAKVHHYDNCYNNDIFNMFTQEEQYTSLLKPIPELHQVQQNDSNVIFEVSSMEQGGGIVDQHPVTVEETQADESLAKHKALELEIERLLKAVASQDIMSIVQNNSVVDTSNLQTELERMKERFGNSYNDMQQKIERLQAQLGDLRGKSKDTSCVSDTLDPLPQKLENKNVELEFQIRNYGKENAHIKAVYKNLFDSINVTQTQTKTIIDSLQTKLHDTIYENAKLRAQLFDKVSEQKDTTKGTSVNTQFCKQSILGKPPSFSGLKLYSVTPFLKSKGLPKIDESHALTKPVTSNLVPTPTESKVVKNDRINPFKASRVDNFMPNKHVKASVRTKLITFSQPRVITKNDVKSKTNGFSSKDVKSTTRTRRPRPRNRKHS
ncbi:hypothetical protein Tco_0717081 [Tanacetum coccineum]